MFSNKIEVTVKVRNQIKEFAEASFREGRGTALDDPAFLLFLGFTEEEVKVCVIWSRNIKNDVDDEFNAAIARMIKDRDSFDKTIAYADLWSDAYVAIADEAKHLND